MTVIGPPPVRRKSSVTIMLERLRDQAPVVYRCLDCGHTDEGTNGDVRERMRQHRIDKHPERPAYASKPKKPKAPSREQTKEDRKILAALDRNAKKTRTPRVYKRKVDPEQVRHMYVDKGMAKRQIARELGVCHDTVSRNLRDLGVQNHQLPPGNSSYITGPREEAAWTLYQAGWTGTEIAAIAFDLWGYSTPKQCRRSLYDAFKARDRSTRPAQRRVKDFLVTMGDDEARRILHAAEALLEEVA
jgi:hypothetical protein